VTGKGQTRRMWPRVHMMNRRQRERVIASVVRGERKRGCGHC
jgi:hypothetical protein